MLRSTISPARCVLAHLASNLDYEYLNALEAAAKRCARVPQVVEKYAEFSASVASQCGRRLIRDMRPASRVLVGSSARHTEFLT
jgi:hypothetical protein